MSHIVLWRPTQIYTGEPIGIKGKINDTRIWDALSFMHLFLRYSLKSVKLLRMMGINTKEMGFETTFSKRGCPSTSQVVLLDSCVKISKCYGILNPDVRIDSSKNGPLNPGLR